MKNILNIDTNTNLAAQSTWIITANRGEYSELYALGKLIVDKELHSAGDNLEYTEENPYRISKITTQASSNNKIIYDISSDDDVCIFHPSSGTEVVIKRSSIKNQIEKFFVEIRKKHKGGGAFHAEGIEEILSLLSRKKISATSFQKADLNLEIYDLRLSKYTEHGYSIKSSVGGKSTLFNASKSTNFVFKIKGLDKSLIEEINMLDSCRKRASRIIELGGEFIYEKPDSSIFANNLGRIDSNFDMVISLATLIFFSTDARITSDIVKLLPEKKFGNVVADSSFYKYNFIKFLYASALGMVANTPWEGVISVEGGIIIVKKDGVLIGYNAGSINKFQKYLYNNTFFDSPDTRNGYGSLYEENGELKFKLNFQIRFKN